MSDFLIAAKLVAELTLLISYYVQVCRKLFIFAGQRGKEYLNDFYTLDVDTQIVQAVCDWGVSGAGDGPASGFTQRATIDPDLNEIYVLSVRF